MAIVIFDKKQQRVRCSDEEFMQAIYSSKTYAEISEKTGQKLASTIARYARVKKQHQEKGLDIPSISTKVQDKDIKDLTKIVDISKRLKQYHDGV